MSLKHRLLELEASIDPAVLRVAADEYSGLLLTLRLCMKVAGPTRAGVRVCASELEKRLTTWHSHKELNAILSSWGPVGYVLNLRREASDNARIAGGPVNVFV